MSAAPRFSWVGTKDASPFVDHADDTIGTLMLAVHHPRHGINHTVKAMNNGLTVIFLPTKSIKLSLACEFNEMNLDCSNCTRPQHW
jgi:hypothetical protein